MRKIMREERICESGKYEVEQRDIKREKWELNMNERRKYEKDTQKEERWNGRERK
jgi:hypothetical protein